MGKRKPNTPRSAVRSALRRLWLRSRERQSALKRDGYRCQKCGLKQSKAKGREVYIEVHHADGVEFWEEIIDLIYRSLLCHPDRLETLCSECHKNRKGEKP